MVARCLDVAAEQHLLRPESRMRKGVEQCQQLDRLPSFEQALGRFEHHQTSERVTHEKIRATRLNSPDHVHITLSDLFYCFGQPALQFAPSRSHSIDWM